MASNLVDLAYLILLCNKMKLQCQNLTLLIITCGILSRLIPHLPNFSPEIVFALYLGTKHSKTSAYMNILLMAVISDLLLSWGHAWPAFGDWTIFTYSALLIIGWIGEHEKLQKYDKKFIITAFAVTLAYWIWTNLGVWLMSNSYSHSLPGLIQCYEMALPFLSTSLAAGGIWCAIILVCEHYVATNSKSYT